MPQIPHILIFSAAQNSPSPLGITLMGFRVPILSQQLSASGSGVHWSQSLCHGPGNIYHITLGHGGVQGGTRPKRVASLNILQRIRSLHSWSQFRSKASPTNLCSARQVPAQLHQLSPYTLPSAHRLPSSRSRPDGRILTPSQHGFYLTHQPSWQTTSLQPA